MGLKKDTPPAGLSRVPPCSRGIHSPASLLQPGIPIGPGDPPQKRSFPGHGKAYFPFNRKLGVHLQDLLRGLLGIDVTAARFKCHHESLATMVFIMASGGDVCAQSPKELRFKGTHYYGHTSKIIKIDQDQMIVQFETLGLRVNENGRGPFHEASVHIVGILYRGKNGHKLRAFETWTDADGDKLIWELTEKASKDSAPGTSPGTAAVFSGTGKYMGMQGTMDWILRYPKSFPEGTGRGICLEEVTLIPAK